MRGQWFRYQGGLVSRVDAASTPQAGNTTATTTATSASGYTRLHDSEKRRREAEWNTMRRDLHVTTVRLTAARSGSAPDLPPTPTPQDATTPTASPQMDAGVSLGMPHVTTSPARDPPAGGSVNTNPNPHSNPNPNPTVLSPSEPILTPKKLWERQTPRSAVNATTPLRTGSPGVGAGVSPGGGVGVGVGSSPMQPAPTLSLHSQDIIPAMKAGVFVAATAGVLASLRLIKDRRTVPPHSAPSEAEVSREVIGCALESLVELVGRGPLDAYMKEWLGGEVNERTPARPAPKTPPPPPQARPLHVPYTPHVEYEGVLYLISTQRGQRAWENAASIGDVTVGASSVACGAVTDLVENAPRAFATQAEGSPWVGLQLEGVKVRPTHYTVGYHPGGEVAPPTAWQLEGLVEVEGGGGGGGGAHWIVLSSHVNDTSFLPGSTEVVASFMLQPTSLSFCSFRLAMPPTPQGLQAMPFSALELYGTVEPS